MSFRHVVFLSLAILMPCISLAATSTNFTTKQESTGAVDFYASSSNYKFNAEVGNPGIGISTSTNYIYWHGTFWEDEDAIKATIKWATPELRVGPAFSNDDAVFYLTIRTSLNTDDVVEFTMPALATTSNDGTYGLPLEFNGLADGVYDIGIKTNQHLTKILQDINLTNTTTTVLNFSQLDNSTPHGSEVLLGGDINNIGVNPVTLGDDVINSVDLSIIVTELDLNDATGNDYRSNLNQDTVINSVDLSILLKNLDLEGQN